MPHEVDVEVDGRRVHVVLPDQPDVLVVEGRRFTLVAGAPGGNRISLNIGGRVHQVDITRAGGSVLVRIEGREYAVRRTDARDESGRQSRDQTIRAVMPGKIVAVAVTAGTIVPAGAPLVVLEAMKMQNEVVAPHAGTVLRVHVQPGSAVAAGDPLLELGPPT